MGAVHEVCHTILDNFHSTPGTGRLDMQSMTDVVWAS